MTISPKDNDLHLSPLSGPPLSPTSFSLETQPLEIVPEDQLFKTHCWLISLLSVMIFMIIIIILIIIFIPNITKIILIILYNFESFIYLPGTVVNVYLVIFTFLKKGNIVNPIFKK